jgi:hypothetical protein
MTLCAWPVPRSVLGRWGGVQKTTIVRGGCGLALAWWPLVYPGRGEQVKAQMVSGEEPWRQSRGRWPYGFVVLDVTTELPGLAALLPAPSPGAWGGRGWPRRRRQQGPRVLIPEGFQA